MTALILPTTSMPGQRPQESGGRLTNCFAESLGETAGTPFKLVRAPGLRAFGATSEIGFRGGFQAGALIYTAWSGKVNTHTSVGGAGADLTGTLSGSDPVFFARNNKATPDLVIVSPDNGAFVATTAAVSAYPDADVGAPNSVCFLKGYFIFGYGTGAMRASGLNATSINTLDTATAESKPDTLYRVLARGDTLIAAGSESIEFWGINGEATGFPFSPITTHDRGIAGRYAIGGHEEGFGYGIFFIADDFTVRQLEGYGSVKISPPDLDRLIEATTDKSGLQVSVYVTQGHPFVVVQGSEWTWEYDVILQRWHERTSYNLTRWRGLLPFKGFDRWLCGDTQSGNLLSIDTNTRTEAGQPLLAEIETGPMGNFPLGARVNRLDLFISAGTGYAPGTDPIETDPSIDIFVSKDLGLSWSNAWRRKIGPQGRSPNVTVNNLGHCGPKGIRLKFRFSDPVHVALMGGDVQFQPLRN
jgi:hypothetical protein